LSSAEIEQRRLEADRAIADKARVVASFDDPSRVRMRQDLARRLAQMVRSPTYLGAASRSRAADPTRAPVEKLVFFSNFTDPQSLQRDAGAPPDAQIYAYLDLHHQPDGTTTEEWRVFEVVGPESHAFQAQPEGAGTNSPLGLPVSGREQSPEHPEWLWFQKFEGGTLAELAARPGYLQRYDTSDVPVGEPYADVAPVDLTNRRRTVMRADLVPNQYDVNNYQDAEFRAARGATCGCAAFVAVAAAIGKTVTLDEACALAGQRGADGVYRGVWDPGGWHGPATWNAFVNAHGVPFAMPHGTLSPAARRDIEEAVHARKMVVISTVPHYWVIEGWNEELQRYYLGNSGRSGPGGSEYMTLDAIESNGVNGVLIAE
jgi:hypothetical protein